MLKRPILVLALMTAVIGLATNSSPLKAGKPGGGGSTPPPTPRWLYLDAEGGWLDLNTGLIWGQNTYDFFLQLGNETYGSWDYTKNTLLPAYCDATGFDDWRMPTSAEVAQAAASQYYEYVLEGVPTGICCPEITWISGGNSTWRYYGNLETGTATRTLQARSGLPATFVRRYVAP